MPTASPKPCTQCGTLVRDGSSRCDAHKVRPGSFADTSRGSRHARGYGRDWERRREQVLQRDSGLCQVCLEAGHVKAGNEVDHKIPKAQGGTDDEANLQTICRECHATKSALEGVAAQGRGGQKSGRSPRGTASQPNFFARRF